MYFRNLIFSALAVAIIAGACFSAYQMFFITPLILDSEVYEISGPVSSQIEAWSPADGTERDSWSFVSNLLVAFAYALILSSAMSLKSSVNMVKGVFWGGGAYLSIFVAPAIGLPPEIPGMEAAQLEGRQAWWFVTVVVTALSLWLIAFYNIVQKVIGLILMILPHVIGAPQPIEHGFVNPDPQAVLELNNLWHDFIIQTSIANALLWLIIGAGTGYLVNRYVNTLDVLDTEKL